MWLKGPTLYSNPDNINIPVLDGKYKCIQRNLSFHQVGVQKPGLKIALSIQLEGPKNLYPYHLKRTKDHNIGLQDNVHFRALSNGYSFLG